MQMFSSTVCVLGWEVVIMNSTDWDPGVVRILIQRKGNLSLSLKEGFWVLGLNGRDYWAKIDLQS